MSKSAPRGDHEDTIRRWLRRATDANAPFFQAVGRAFLNLRKPEDLSGEEPSMLTLLRQAHPQVRGACELAQAFVQMVRKRNASALEPWLKAASESGIPELRTFALEEC